ncbi:MAG: rhamnulokinase [Clostridiales bacterium]|nr:rhamnulokinase [Clostridiales bacterium]
MMPKKVLAFDLGASSGRVIAGSFDGSKLTLEELHRFSNDPVTLGDTFYWDFQRLIYNIKLGIQKASSLSCESMGVDTWGVDFGLIDKNGRLVDNPVHYRDARNIPMPEEVFKKVPAERVYASTGIQIMDINTIFQLYYISTRSPELIDMTDSMLFTPDLINYYLSGAKVSEYSIASTSQMLDANTRDWDRSLLSDLGIKQHILRDIVPCGTKLGPLSAKVAEELNVKPLDVIATAGHDTASAVAAVPVKNKTGNWAYLSSGTWSLLGMELDRPLINDETFDANFTNEGGVGNTIRFLKNIIGLWLMQESRRQWQREGSDMSFKDIDVLTAASKPLQRFIDPDYPEFVRPGNMPQRIADFCAATNQPLPETKGDISRTITESLALKYRRNIEQLERLTGKKIDVLHIIGGGCKDKLLCEYTACATGKTVVAGPTEATATGNILTQLITDGCFKDVAEARECVERSYPVTVYEPKNAAEWDDAYNRFVKIIK